MTRREWKRGELKAGIIHKIRYLKDYPKDDNVFVSLDEFGSTHDRFGMNHMPGAYADNRRARKNLAIDLRAVC